MKILAFGEIMMRVSPEGRLRFRQAMPGKVDVTFAGAEANVCASLSMLGMQTRFLTVLPENAISECVVSGLRSMGIDTESIIYQDRGRLGIYFVETGANQRSSSVVYDREYSSISMAGPNDYDFDGAISGADWLHVTGITPSLSEKAYLSVHQAVRRAKEKGLVVSCDLNFRKKLWRWKSGYTPEKLARKCMRSILPYVDVLIANEEDAKDVLNVKAEGTSIEKGDIKAEAYEPVARRISEDFPNIKKIAFTLRGSVSADYNKWGGLLFDKLTDRVYIEPVNSKGEYAPYHIMDIVDRVGGGDSFCAGLIFGLNSKAFKIPGKALAFAVASSCLKHSIKGDYNYISREEVVALMEGSASGRVRR